MAKLSGILQIATEHGYIPANPARSVRNVPADDDEREITILAPVELERVITGPDRPGPGDHAARRAPRAATVGDPPRAVGRVRRPDPDDRPVAHESDRRRSRVIAVPRVTAHELRAWQLESGGRGSDPIIGEMTENALKLWARRHLPDGIRVTDLRH